jgi:hypothetical protein
MTTTELLMGLDEGGKGGEKLGFRVETGQGVHDDILRCRYVRDVEPNWVTHE